MTSPIGPDHIYQLVSVGDANVSGDGARLACTQSWIDMDSMESRSRIMVMDLPDGELAPLGVENAKKDSLPKFAPDGSSIAFIRPDEKDKRQVWLAPISGGEVRQVTDMPGGVGEYAWAPDSKRLAVVSDVDPDRTPEGHDSKLDPRVRVVRRIKHRYDTLGWRGDAHSHIYVVGVDGGEALQVTDGDWDDRAPVWSPDGQRIAFMSSRREDRDFVDYNEAYVVDSGGGEAELWSEGLYSVGGLGWSLDSLALAVLGSDDPQANAGWQSWLFVLRPGQAPVRLTDDSLNPGATWAPSLPSPSIFWTGGERIFFLADSRGETYLIDASASGGSMKKLTGGGVAMTGLAMDAQARRVVVSVASPSSPGDLHLLGLSSGESSQIADYNHDYFAAHSPASLEKFSITREGMEIQCRLWLPPGFDSSRQYPLVLDIHGGPNGVFTDGFNSLQQVLATSGYLVLCVNPRGSSSYGVDFTKAVLEDWGGEDFLDIIAAVDDVCGRPYVDSSRLGVHGFSYGGYMTTWIVGHDRRFGAAVAGAPCIDLPSLYYTSDIGVSFGELHLGGTAMDNFEAMRERSPLTYAPNVETPVLLMHGEADFRCPINQSEQYFTALKRLGKEVELVRFPDSSHSLNRSGHPRLREEYLKRALDWFNSRLGRTKLL